MIKIFRNIRRRLLTENRFAKYLLYAIGEIVLVVIGILIALQINIWNENRKATERTEQLLVNVQKELLLNIKNSNKVIEQYRRKDSIIYKVLNNKATYNDYKYNWDYSMLLAEEPGGFFIADDAFKNFIVAHNKSSVEQDSIVIQLKELYGLDKKRVSRFEKLTIDVVDKFYNTLESEKEWYVKFISFNEINDNMIEYFLNDPLYVNYVSSYELIGIDNHLRFTISFRNKSILIYEEISEELNLRKDTLVAKNIEIYKHYIGTYKADSLYSCSIKVENNELIMYNLEQNDSTLSWKKKIYPDSKRHFTYWNSFGQLNFDKNNEVSELIRSCGDFRKVYKKVK